MRKRFVWPSIAVRYLEGCLRKREIGTDHSDTRAAAELQSSPSLLGWPPRGARRGPGAAPGLGLGPGPSLITRAAAAGAWI